MWTWKKEKRRGVIAMKRLAGLLMVLMCLFITPVGAQSPNDLPLDKWTGNEFVILDLPQDRQAQGYDLYIGPITVSDLKGENVDRIPHVSYDHHGKHVIITSVEPAQWENEQYYVVRMTEKGSNLQLTARSFQGQVDSLGLAADLEKARKEFLGKTIYAKRSSLIGLPNPETVLAPFGQAMQVKDAWFGFDTSAPILLVVEYDKTRAVLPVAYSWTNQYPGSWQSSPAWEKNFFAEDPRKIAGDSGQIWSMIVDARVQEGMNGEQVRLSWGSPKKVESKDKNGMPGAVWTYGNYKLHFVNNTLAQIETLPAEQASVQ